MDDNQLRAVFIAGCVGSLSKAVLRYASQREGVVAEGNFEIISLNGLLGETKEHLHIQISDHNGETRSGHVMAGCTVRTTLELVLGELSDLVFTHEPDSMTGHSELAVSHRNADRFLID